MMFEPMKDLHIGFTGTQEGMTEQQEFAVQGIIAQFGRDRFLYGHHGDCIGADADFHRLMRSFGFVRMIGHPPIRKNKRAFCDFDFCNDAKPFLDRNKDIVDSVKSEGFLVVCPKGFEEELRSGTWSTYRYAMKQNCNTLVVFPDGSQQIFRLRSNIKEQILRSNIKEQN